MSRGNIFHYINNAIENWYKNGPKVASGNNIYSDKTVILIHIITCLFRIGLRQTTGFIKGYLKQIGKGLQVISYSQASRRFKKLNIKIRDRRYDKNNMENIEIAIDSTGISIYNNIPGHSKANGADRKYHGYEQTRRNARYKQTFGFNFRNKSEVNRERKVLLKCYLLNKFTNIGMAKFQVVS